MVDIERLKRKAQKYKIDLNGEISDKILEYSKIMLEWNSHSNLTAIVEPEEIENKHFIDALYLAKQPEVEGHVADVGTGPGFPGIILKLYNPNIKLTLIESNKKKIVFLGKLIHALQIEAELREERAEDLGRGVLREQMDMVTARAVSALPALAEYCLPLVKVGGCFIPMKGRIEEERESGLNAIDSLGGKLRQERPYTLPDGSERRLYVIEKIKQTDIKYPRNAARIKKNPL